MFVRLALLPGLFLAALIAVSLPSGAPPVQAAAEQATYRITLTNISTEQPLSAPILATHSPMTRLIVPGGIAGEGLRKLAEEGQNLDLAQEWRAMSNVHDVVVGDQPLGRVGSDDPEGPASISAVFEISAGSGDVLTIAAMLGCTNDGFTGVSSMILPDSEGSFFFRPIVLDAGTELNTEKSVDLADSCGTLGAQSLAEDGNAHEATTQPISLHPNLNLTGDLTEASAWSGPVLQVKVERIGIGNDLVAAPSIPRGPLFIQFTPPGTTIVTSSQSAAGAELDYR